MNNFVKFVETIDRQIKTFAKLHTGMPEEEFKEILRSLLNLAWGHGEVEGLRMARKMHGGDDATI